MYIYIYISVYLYKFQCCTYYIVLVDTIGKQSCYDIYQLYKNILYKWLNATINWGNLVCYALFYAQ